MNVGPRTADALAINPKGRFVLGLMYAVTVCGSSPGCHVAPLGAFGITTDAQSTSAGIPLPDVEGSWKTPNLVPPFSGVSRPRCDPGAMAIPVGSAPGVSSS